MCLFERQPYERHTVVYGINSEKEVVGKFSGSKCEMKFKSVMGKKGEYENEMGHKKTGRKTQFLCGIVICNGSYDAAVSRFIGKS